MTLKQAGMHLQDCLEPGPGAIFFFARQAMTLLEVVCRLCNSDTSGRALDDLSAEIERRDRRYFTVLPGPCWAPNQRTRAAFSSPVESLYPDNQLIAAIFNLVRTGRPINTSRCELSLRMASNLGFR